VSVDDLLAASQRAGLTIDDDEWIERLETNDKRMPRLLAGEFDAGTPRRRQATARGALL
jgi:hypothetical protein